MPREEEPIQQEEAPEVQREDPSLQEAEVERKNVQEEVIPMVVPREGSTTRRRVRREESQCEDVQGVHELEDVATKAELLRPSPALQGKSNVTVYFEDTEDLFGEEVIMKFHI